MNMEKKLSNMFSSMSKEDLIDFLKDCNVEIDSVNSGMGGIYLDENFNYSVKSNS